MIGMPELAARARAGGLPVVAEQEKRSRAMQKAVKICR
jgi:hypothetical protein